jgi:hypothetical protein
MDWTHTVSPSLVNEARFGVNYVFLNNGSAANGLSGYGQTLGIADVPSSLPAVDMSIGSGSTVRPASEPATTWNSSPTR